jgi:putative molybdopterin biosynthesis protein
MRDRTKWLTSREAADMCGVSDNCIRDVVERGELPAYRIGKQLRFRRDDVERYLAAAVSGNCPK